MSDFDFSPHIDFSFEKHIAAAMFLLNKAMIVSQAEGNIAKEMNAILRDASEHCKQAQSCWTPEAQKRNEEIRGKLFERTDS